MKAFLSQIGKMLAVLAAMAFWGLGDSAEAYTHHEKSCAVHSHENGSAHTDCEDTETGHRHDGRDSCKLGHCHSSHCGTFSQQLIALQSFFAFKFSSHMAADSAYLNPYLGLPLHPPRAVA